MSHNRVALVMVIDAVGLSTIEYLLSKHKGPVNAPNMAKMGLGKLLKKEYADRLSGVADGDGYAEKIFQASASADSVIGHREMMGIVDDRTYNLFPEGFRKDYIAELEKRIGRKTIFNKMAGGVEAIELNCAEHEKTGFPIVYASKCDPLIQIAMNESVIPVAEQHKIADTAFNLAMEMGIPVTRAIARAYVRAADGEIIRTANRHDAVLPMEKKTLVDILYGMDVWTVAVGKTSELVNTAYHEKLKMTKKVFVDPSLGLKFVHPKGKDTNPFSVQSTVNALVAAKNIYRPNGTFIFSNLVDTDSLYGHTRDVEGGIKCIEEVDRIIPIVKNHMRKDDILIITADHGMAHKADYGYHNNEPLPLLAEHIGHKNLAGIKAGKGKTLADVGYIVAQQFGCEEEFLTASGTASLIR